MAIKLKELGIKAAAGEEESSPDSDVVIWWLKEVDEARKREKDWRKEAKRIVSLYEGDKADDYQYNILYSNTETMLPALYNSTPRPIVQRRFKDEDPLGKMASKAAERTLEYLIDNGDSSYTSFDDLMKSAVLEGLVPGRGLTRFKYDAVVEGAQNEAAAEGAEPEGPDTEDKPEAGTETPPSEDVKYETVCGEEIPWDRFLHGNAKKWKDVPWGAIEHFMTREELEKNFGELGARIPVSEMAKESGTGDESDPMAKGEDLKGIKVAQVYEIWDKDEKRVIFISPQWKEAPLKSVPDPLSLSGFFPWPQPIMFTSKISSLIPVPLYTMYEAQAKELNRITTRINKITNALKVRGMYDSTVEGIDKVMAAEDNVLIPAENVAAMLAQGNALEKAIWLMPIEKLVAVLQQLYLNRTQIKTVIYEITGIADIMRGSSQASETLGAQQIKNQWGTLRLKKTQKEVMRYCRDCLRIMAEIAVSKLSPDTMKSMTGLPFPMQGQKDQMQATLAQMKAQYQAVAQQAQMAGQQPPPPPEIPPQVQQALSMPSWEELLALLQDDTQRSYRIDIETNSTVDAEATEDKQDISELLNAMSQFLNGVGPMVKDGTMPFSVAQGILLAVVRRYRFGPELEDQLKEMKAPPPPVDPKVAEQQKAEVEKAGQQVKAEQEKLADQQRELERKTEDAQRNIAALQKEAEAEIAMQRKELEMEKAFALKELEMQKAFAAKSLDLEQQSKNAAHEIAVQKSENKLQLKATVQGEQLKHQSDAVAGKAKEVAAKEQKLDPKALMEPVVAMLSESFQGMGDQLAEVLTTVKRPKRAVKGADGSWSTVIDKETA